MLGGVVLAVCGMALPYTMFAGEAQTHLLMDSYLAIGPGALFATGLIKAALTPFCIHMGWRGGHFFPLIFSGVSIGYGFSLLTGADPVSCVAGMHRGMHGAVMRQPVMTALLLIMCFPVKGVVVTIAAAAIGAAIPLPRRLRLPSRRGTLRRRRTPCEKSRRQANDQLPHARGRAETFRVWADHLRVRACLPHLLDSRMARRSPNLDLRRWGVVFLRSSVDHRIRRRERDGGRWRAWQP